LASRPPPAPAQVAGLGAPPPDPGCGGKGKGGRREGVSTSPFLDPPSTSSAVLDPPRGRLLLPPGAVASRAARPSKERGSLLHPSRTATSREQRHINLLGATWRPRSSRHGGIQMRGSQLPERVARRDAHGRWNASRSAPLFPSLSLAQTCCLKMQIRILLAGVSLTRY
jgi:hypothetical protein